jgi:hypothetical protein
MRRSLPSWTTTGSGANGATELPGTVEAHRRPIVLPLRAANELGGG